MLNWSRWTSTASVSRFRRSVLRSWVGRFAWLSPTVTGSRSAATRSTPWSAPWPSVMWTTAQPRWLRPTAWVGPAGCCSCSTTLSRAGDMDDRRRSANGLVSRWWSVSACGSGTSNASGYRSRGSETSPVSPPGANVVRAGSTNAVPRTLRDSSVRPTRRVAVQDLPGPMPAGCSGLAMHQLGALDDLPSANQLRRLRHQRLQQPPDSGADDGQRRGRLLLGPPKVENRVASLTQVDHEAAEESRLLGVDPVELSDITGRRGPLRVVPGVDPHHCVHRLNLRARCFPATVTVGGAADRGRANGQRHVRALQGLTRSDDREYTPSKLVM